MKKRFNVNCLDFFNVFEFLSLLTESFEFRFHFNPLFAYILPFRVDVWGGRGAFESAQIELFSSIWCDKNIVLFFYLIKKTHLIIQCMKRIKDKYQNFLKLFLFSDLKTGNPTRMVNYKGKTGTKIFARTQTIKIILTTKKLKVGRNILAIENSFELLLPLLSLYFSYSWNERKKL